MYGKSPGYSKIVASFPFTHGHLYTLTNHDNIHSYTANRE